MSLNMSTYIISVNMIIGSENTLRCSTAAAACSLSPSGALGARRDIGGNSENNMLTNNTLKGVYVIVIFTLFSSCSPPFCVVR